MNTTPYTSTITSADTVPGPGQGNWTYDDYAAMPEDGKRYQIVDGVLFMSPSPDTRHHDTVGAIFVYLRDHAIRNEMGKVYIAPLDVELTPKTVVQPDVLVILTIHLERNSDKRIIGVQISLSKSLYPARLDLIAARSRMPMHTQGFLSIGSLILPLIPSNYWF